ncbi:MAG: cell division protein ZapE, partial [Gammaproteobacteria bacterium]|nr:cell division protein ZapE [Gammaproteobacteria bacterium]
MTTPLQKYQQDLQRDDFLFDAAQQNAVQQLERLYQQFVKQKPAKQGFLDKLLGKKPEAQPLQGLYFWGGVGRGKTYLVDTFYECLPTTRKLRIHFHRFMHKVHQ